jgi:hypothetical protein
LEKVDEIPDLPALPSLLAIMVWKISVILTLGASLSYLKRIVDVVCNKMFLALLLIQPALHVGSATWRQHVKVAGVCAASLC